MKYAKPVFKAADVDSLEVSISIPKGSESSSQFFMEYVKYGDEYGTEGCRQPVTLEDGGEEGVVQVKMDLLEPMTTYKIRVVEVEKGGGEEFGEEAVLDTPPPGCSGKKKKKKWGFKMSRK